MTNYKMTNPIPTSVTTPDRVDSSIGTLEYFDGVATPDTVSNVYDYLDRSRAVEVFLNSIPTMSAESIRVGQAAAGADASNKVCLFETLMDSTTCLLTGNTSTMYAVGWLDLKADGPTVVDLPSGMLGILDDMGFLYMTDLGQAGPDKGKGGKFLVLPPGHTGDVPDGYFVVQSNTYGVWLFMRGNIDNGVKVAADHIRDNLKVYSLAKASNPPAMEFINVSGKQMNTVLPNDDSFFEKLHAVIQREPDDFLGPEAKGMMAAVGIVKGKPFAPDARMKKVFTDAAAIGNAAARAISYSPRNPGQFVYEGNKTWVMGYANKETTYTHNGARDLEGRVFFHFGYICVSPAMAVSIAGGGSDYAMAAIDSKGDALDGGKTYKLNVPANPPVNDFWAVTMYDTQTRSQLQTDQQFPTLGSQDKGVETNADGSLDIYFAPEAPAGHEKNWLQTIPGKSWFIAFRLYGPLQAWIDQTWRLEDIELVN